MRGSFVFWFSLFSPLSLPPLFSRTFVCIKKERRLKNKNKLHKLTPNIFIGSSFILLYTCPSSTFTATKAVGCVCGGVDALGGKVTSRLSSVLPGALGRAWW